MWSREDMESSIVYQIYKNDPSAHVLILFLGNKTDLTELLEPAKALADSLVKKHGLIGYYEISVLDSKNPYLFEGYISYLSYFQIPIIDLTTGTVLGSNV